MHPKPIPTWKTNEFIKVHHKGFSLDTRKPGQFSILHEESYPHLLDEMEVIANDTPIEEAVTIEELNAVVNEDWRFTGNFRHKYIYGYRVGEDKYLIFDRTRKLTSLKEVAVQ